MKNLELDKNFRFAFKIHVFNITLKFKKKKIGGPSTFNLKLFKEHRESLYIAERFFGIFRKTNIDWSKSTLDYDQHEKIL